MKSLKLSNKNNRGITLIALIITIVILLIIAVVSIQTIQDSKIIPHANNAAGDYKAEKEREEGYIVEYEGLLNEYATGGSSISNELGNEIGNEIGGGSEPVSGNLGKYVRYDVNGDGTIEVDDQYESILWRVLRDDDEKVELITADVLGINEEGLGPIDLTPTDFNDMRNKYNGVVSTIIQKCRELTGISTVRSVGGPDIDETTETIVFRDLTEFAPQEGADFSQYEGENGFKVEDYYFEEDFAQMRKAGVEEANNSKMCLLASRETYTFSDFVTFYVRALSGSGRYDHIGLGDLSCYADPRVHEGASGSIYYGVRPVLTLEAGILDNITDEEGTTDNPIEIYQSN